jgi:transcriptional regulator with PAS, ATPase and Fis domain
MDLKKLKEPFPAEDIEWRIQSSGKGNSGIWALVLAYVTARAITDRLDAVCGMEGWQNDFKDSANGGTLFLDEIGDMAYSTQAKILRVLEARVVEPVGSNKKKEVDVRIICATNKNLEEEITKNNFRSDLYYRINEVSITLPPLRERLSDLHLMLSQMFDQYNKEFSKEIKGISVSALGVLQGHSWPGNIRELRNVIKRTMAITDHDTIWVEHLPVHLRTTDVETIFDSENIMSLREMEKIYITKVLMFVQGNKTKASKLLKIDRSTLYEKIAKYNIVI